MECLPEQHNDNERTDANITTQISCNGSLELNISMEQLDVLDTRKSMQHEAHSLTLRQYQCTLNRIYFVQSSTYECKYTSTTNG